MSVTGNNSVRDETLQNKRVLLITNIPSPYRIPLFNLLNGCLQAAGATLHVLFGARGYSHRLFKLDLNSCRFSYEILPSGVLSRSRARFTYRGLLSVVRRYDPHVVVSYGFSLATMKLWLRSWFKPVPYLIWSGVIAPRRGGDSLLRIWQRRVLVQRAAGYIAYGTAARDYFLSLGARPDRVHVAINTVDTDFFAHEAQRLRGGPAAAPPRVLLYVGYLTERKRVDHVLHAIRLLSSRRNDFVLSVVGDGAERERLEKLTGDLGITEFVRFEGFVQPPELPRHYAGAYCFLFPSAFDIWGLVLIEAMASGLPCLASIHAGATRDLVHDGENGFVADFADTETVAGKIEWLLDHPEQSAHLGFTASQSIRQRASLSACAAGFTDAIRHALAVPQGPEVRARG